MSICYINKVGLKHLTNLLHLAGGRSHGNGVFAACMQSYEEERRIRIDQELRCQRLTLELADTKQHIQEGDYRRDNYPNIKRFVCVCGGLHILGRLKGSTDNICVI